jgi:hypothetical protein
MDQYKGQIFDNLFEAVYQCLRAMETWEISLSNPENEVRFPLT